MKTRGDLFDKLFEHSRPIDFREQDVGDNERQLVAFLDEAVRLGIIADEVFNAILAYIKEHLAAVRMHLETTEYWQRNLWFLHNNFCIGLKKTFTEETKAVAA